MPIIWLVAAGLGYLSIKSLDELTENLFKIVVVGGVVYIIYKAN